MNQTKFFGTGAVWDSNRSKLLCEFKNGIFITDDEYTVTFLRKFKYPEEVVEGAGEIVAPEDLRWVNPVEEKEPTPVVEIPKPKRSKK